MAITSATLGRGVKVKLRNAANAIFDESTGRAKVQLGSDGGTVDSGDIVDEKGRPYPSTYLAFRFGYGSTVSTQFDAQEALYSTTGLTEEQVDKMDALAAGTHSPKQRAQRVAAFLRKVAQNPSYCGRS